MGEEEPLKLRNVPENDKERKQAKDMDVSCPEAGVPNIKRIERVLGISRRDLEIQSPSRSYQGISKDPNHLRGTKI